MHGWRGVDTGPDHIGQPTLYLRVGQVAQPITHHGQTYIAPDGGQAGKIVKAVDKWVVPYGFHASYYAIDDGIMRIPLAAAMEPGRDEDPAIRFSRMLAELTHHAEWLRQKCSDGRSIDEGREEEVDPAYPGPITEKCIVSIERMLRFLAAKSLEVELLVGGPGSESVKPPPVVAPLGQQKRRRVSEEQVFGRVTSYLEPGVLVVGAQTYVLGAPSLPVGTNVRLEVAESRSGIMRIARFGSVLESRPPRPKSRD